MARRNAWVKYHIKLGDYDRAKSSSAGTKTPASVERHRYREVTAFEGMAVLLFGARSVSASSTPYK